MPLAAKTRPLWEDRFSRPTEESLLAELPKPAAGLASAFREAARTIEGVSEEMGWHGVPWRWSFVMNAGDRIVAYLVPNPARTTVCIPVPAGVVSAAAAKKLSRTVRDAIRLSPSIGGVQWPQWELSSKSLVDELASLLKLCVEAPVAV